jgi:hypothetical protein
MIVALAIRSSALPLSVVATIFCLHVIVNLKRLALALFSVYRRPVQLAHYNEHTMKENLEKHS